jgi:predicted lysophospholipase L1 biosynthesis ABC-type transport system permease subunit
MYRWYKKTAFLMRSHIPLIPFPIASSPRCLPSTTPKSLASSVPVSWLVSHPTVSQSFSEHADSFQGASISTGVLTVPALRLSTTPPDTLRQQWADLYDIGKLWFPPGAIVTSAAFAQIAWLTRQSGGIWKPWVFAAASIFATIPFTVLVMMGGIKELRICEESKVPGLVSKWNRQS